MKCINKFTQINLIIFFMFTMTGYSLFIKNVPNKIDTRKNALIETGEVRPQGVTDIPNWERTISSFPKEETPIYSSEEVSTEYELLDSCDVNTTGGHILFLQDSYTNQKRRNDLWIMDGNGCDQHLVMQNVYGTPGWSLDGKKISVGCNEEDEGYICVLDVLRTFDSCLGREEEINCKPVIIDKYSFPENYTTESLHKVSWFADGKRLFVDLWGDEYILQLENDGVWELFSKSEFIDFALSPVKDEYMISASIKASADGIHLQKAGDVAGGDIIQDKPFWSFDGKKVAFLFYSNGQKNIGEYAGIMQLTFTDEGAEYEVLLSPKILDPNTRIEDILLLHTNSRLTWSPDGRYIFMTSANKKNYDINWFRLDVASGKIYLFSNNGQSISDYVWGPY